MSRFVPVTVTQPFARTAARLARFGLRVVRSGGTSLPGRIALMLDPDFLARARAYPHRILVTGTNGKTSTASMVAELLRARGLHVVTNAEGANLPQGLATTLLDPPGEVLILEVDELTVRQVAATVGPAVMVVTGLSRDQLDRHGEVAMVRGALQAAAETIPDATLVLNGDDPLTASLAAARRLIFRLTPPPPEVPADALDCPCCGALLVHRSSGEAGYCCSTCAFAAPEADITAEARAEGFVVNGRVLPPLPKHLHPYSALAGIAALRPLGVAPELAAWPPPVPGRGSTAMIAGRSVTVVLGKNPASVHWNLSQHPADAHLFLVSNRIADGRDVSWFWDINLQAVRRAVAAGERSLEMLIRLRYEPGVAEAQAFLHAPKAFDAALAATPPGGQLLVVATYTNLAAALKLLRGAGKTAPRAPEASLPERRRVRPRRRRPVRIALLCPDQLGTYADSGNAVVLQRRLEWRGIAASITRFVPGDRLAAGIDAILLGGGEDRGQRLALAALRPMRGELKAMLEDGVPTLLVCGGFQIYGESLQLGIEEVAGLGLLPLVTRRGARRLVGRIGVRSGLVAEPLVGFENHRGCSALLDGAQPFGEVLWGNGNGPEGRAHEGLVLHRTIGTYAHGPMLARNPGLAEVILSWIAERRGFGALEPLDDRLERAAAANRA